MPTLHAKESGELLGEVSSADMQFLVDNLEEESSEDFDYFIDQGTLDLLIERGASETLIALLRKAIAGTDGRDIRYSLP